MAQPVNVYIESADGDETYRDELAVHLDPLQTRGHIRIWHRGKLRPGDAKTATANAELERAELVVLLLSPGLLSKRHDEMTLALGRREKGLRVVLIKVRDCHEALVPQLRDLLILRDGKCPSDKDARDRWFSEAAGQILEIVQDLRKNSDESLPSEDSSPLGKMRTKLKEHLQRVPSIQRRLIDNLNLPKKADLEHLVTALFENRLSAVDLAEALQSALDGLGASDLLTLQEITRLVLPRSKEVRAACERLEEGVRNRHLVLPYTEHAEAEMALAALFARPYQERLHEAETHNETRLVSEALSPASEIRSGSAKAALAEEHFFMEEIARYFATKVKFGPNRRQNGRYICLDGDPDLRNFKEVVGKINAQLRYHQRAPKLADLLTMHIEVDDAQLAERLKEGESAERLLLALGRIFPRLSFVQLAGKPEADPSRDLADGDDEYLRVLLVNIFGHKPS